MKYIVLSFASLILLACVCGSATSPISPTAPLVISTATAAPPAAPTATEAPVAVTLARVGDTVTQGSYSVTVVSIQTAPSFNDFDVPKTGDIYLAVELVVQSGASAGVNVSPLDIKVKDSNGYQYTSGFTGKEPLLPAQNNLPKGDKVRGWCTIELPEKAAGLILTYEPLLDMSGAVRISFDLGL